MTIGTALCVILFTLFPKNKMLGMLGVNSLGIYLFHPFVVEISHNQFIDKGIIPDGIWFILLYSMVITGCLYVFSKSKLSKFIINPVSTLLRK